MSGKRVAAGMAALVLSGCLFSACANSAASQGRFAKMDTNGDGNVVLEEFQSANPGMKENTFMLIDLNNDGVIDSNEWASFMDSHGRTGMAPGQERGAPMNNIPGDPLIPPVDSDDLPLMRPSNE